MSDTEVTTIRLASVAGERFQRLRDPLGVQGFGINLLRLEPGQRGRIHRHLVQEEVFVVLEGELTLGLDGEERTYGPQEVVRVPPAVRRQMINRGSEPTVLLALGASTEHAHQPRDARAWESWDEPGEGRSPADVPTPADLEA